MVQLVDSSNNAEEQISAMENMLEMTTEYLNQTKNQLKKEKDKLEKIQSDLFKSLKFAALIQKAIQPSEIDLRQKFSDVSIYSRPRDIIGGDFVWHFEKDDQTLIACIDCKGHGVPGAMLSMAAYFCLSQIAERIELNSNEYFLKAFNTEFYNYLHKNKASHEFSMEHGFDISLLRYDKSSSKIFFSGTNQQVLYLSNRVSKILKGDRTYVGNKQIDSIREIELNVRSGDIFYLFTDGIPDQFGGSRYKKIGRKRVLQFLTNLQNLNLSKQQEMIDVFLKTWQGNREQTDDMLLIGLKI